MPKSKDGITGPGAMDPTPIRIPKVGMGAGSLANAAGQTAFSEMITAAWQAGVRYFDTSALYLGGQSEERLGAAMRGLARDELFISTKLGRYLKQSGGSSLPGSDSAYYFDYSYDTTLASVDRSLSRLEVDFLDIVFIHDLDPGFAKDAYQDELKSAREGAYRALQHLKEQNVIGAIGIASMDWRACLRFAQLADVDAVMPAGEYSLLRNRSQELLDYCGANKIAWIAASPLNSGILATGAQANAFYHMQPASAAALAQVNAIEAICQRHQIPLATAAMQFPLRHPSVSSIVFGTKTTAEFNETFSRISSPVSDEFWCELDAYLDKTRNWEGN